MCCVWDPTFSTKSDLCGWICEQSLPFPLWGIVCISMCTYNLGKKSWDTLTQSIEIIPLSPLYNVNRDHVVRSHNRSLNIAWWGKGRVTSKCNVLQISALKCHASVALTRGKFHSSVPTHFFFQNYSNITCSNCISLMNGELVETKIPTVDCKPDQETGFLKFHFKKITCLVVTTCCWGTFGCLFIL